TPIFTNVASAATSPSRANAGGNSAPAPAEASRALRFTEGNLAGANSVKVNASPEPAPQRSPMNSTLAQANGLTRVTVTNGVSTMETGGEVSRYTQEKPSGTTAVSTIRSPLGSPRSGPDVRPTDTITVAGYETSVAAAVAAGFIVRNADGSYSD